MQNLFSKGDLSMYVHGLPGPIEKAVKGIPDSDIKSLSEDKLMEEIVDQFIIEPIEIYEEKISQTHQDTMIDVSSNPLRRSITSGRSLVPGIELTMHIPFSGDRELWMKSPSSVYLAPRPKGEISGSTLQMAFSHPMDEHDDIIKRSIEEGLKYLRDCLKAQKIEVEKINQAIPKMVQQAIKYRLEQISRTIDIVNMLNIPLKTKEGMPNYQQIPLKRKVIRPLLSARSPRSEEIQEYGVSSEDFETILSMIRHQGRSFEKTPNTFHVHDEQELRNFILASLNTLYRGQASGETFRGHGKTDIIIDFENKAAFVGECKVWDGSQVIQDSINQLLGYLTWRDCKASLIIFNKSVQCFSKIMDQIPDIFRDHEKFVRWETSIEEGEWRFVLKSAKDDLRHITVHVFAFDITP